MEDAGSHESMGELCELYFVTFTSRVCLLTSYSAYCFLMLEEMGTSKHLVVEWKEQDCVWLAGFENKQNQKSANHTKKILSALREAAILAPGICILNS